MRFSTRLTPGTFSAATTAACRAFSLIEKALQSYGAVANTDVEPAGRPRSARYRGDDAAPNLLVVLRKALGTDYKAGDRRQKVRIRDNANDLVAAQDGQASDAAGLHDPRDHLNRGVLGDGYGLRRHDLTDLATMFALVVKGDLVGAC